jgi:catechol-2,3-dioxygenase
MKDFYTEILGFPLLSADETMFSFQAGESILEFERDDSGVEPFYHFAFSIAENKLEKAIEWMKPRHPLLTQSKTGRQIIHFRRWNAHAVYFMDPAGNIGEFIAHHTLDTARPGDFSLDDVLYNSEIGIVTPNVNQTVDTIKDPLGIRDVPGASPVFSAVGDAHGYFIVVKRDRVWLPTDDVAAKTHPVRAWLKREDRVTFGLPELNVRVDTI